VTSASTEGSGGAELDPPAVRAMQCAIDHPPLALPPSDDHLWPEQSVLRDVPQYPTDPNVKRRSPMGTFVLIMFIIALLAAVVIWVAHP
jgi:hypothetical protein